jgi:hypothetical protein
LIWPQQYKAKFNLLRKSLATSMSIRMQMRVSCTAATSVRMQMRVSCTAARRYECKRGWGVCPPTGGWCPHARERRPRCLRWWLPGYIGFDARGYLPIGLQPLSGIYVGTSPVYAVFMAAWAYPCCIKHCAKAEHIYAMMGVLTTRNKHNSHVDQFYYSKGLDLAHHYNGHAAL